MNTAENNNNLLKFQKGAGIASGTLGILGNVTSNLSNSSLDEIDEIADSEINSVKNFTSKSSLSKFITDWTPQSSESMGLAGLSGAVSGATAGAAAGPWGALAGAVVGGGSALFGASNRNEKREEANKDVIEAITGMNNLLSVKEAQQALANIAAFGGWLNTHGGDYSTGLTSFNEGNSHENNPYNGILQGFDKNGVPNLVEEGETRWNDYIFSNRLNLPKEFIKEFKLGNISNNTTYAKASKKLSKESEERPFDPISKRGRDTMLSRLMEAQETQKFIDDGDAVFNDVISDLGYGEILFSKGGSIHIKDSKKGSFTAAAKKHGKGVQEFAKQVLSNKDNYSTAMIKKANFARNAAKWHDYGGNIENWMTPLLGTSFSAGSMDGVGPKVRYSPIGNINFKVNTSLDLADSSIKNPYESIISPSKLTDISRSLEGKIGSPEVQKLKPIHLDSSNTKDIAGRSNLTKLGLFAPALTNLGLAISDMFSKPETVSFPRVDLSNYMIRRRLPYEPVDREYLANKYRAQAGATTRGIVNTAGGNNASAQAALVAHNYNTLNSLGDLYFKIDELNRQRRMETIEFDDAQDRKLSALAGQQANMNSELDLKEQIINSQNRAAARNARRSAISSVGQSFGEISRYLNDVEKVRNMFDYSEVGDWLYKYLKNTKQ